jgi:hypothetical protein
MLFLVDCSLLLKLLKSTIHTMRVYMRNHVKETYILYNKTRVSGSYPVSSFPSQSLYRPGKARTSLALLVLGIPTSKQYKAAALFLSLSKRFLDLWIECVCTKIQSFLPVVLIKIQLIRFVFSLFFVLFVI